MFLYLCTLIHYFIFCQFPDDEVGSAATAYDLWSELGMLLKVEPHPNICNLLGYCDDKG